MDDRKNGWHKMVEITIFVEGGNLNNRGANVPLREGFSKLLMSGLGTQNFKLNIDLRGPNKQTVKDFKNNPADILVLLDLDAPESERENRLVQFDLNDTPDKVFFMIQAMEAWILSQPDILEKYIAETYPKSGRKREDDNIKDDDILKNKRPQDIEKPDEKLHTLLGRYFYYEKNNTKKKPKYKSKITDGAMMLELLNVNELSNQFTDVKNLLNTIENAK